MPLATILHRLKNGHCRQGEIMKSDTGIEFRVTSDGRHLIVTHGQKKYKAPLLVKLIERPGNSVAG